MKQLAFDLTETTIQTPEELLTALQEEFDRLNAVYFEHKLRRPEIIVSRRKTYGGYYQPRTHRIVLSWQAFCEHGWEESLNTFRHEVAHIVYMNHTKAFWELARRLGSLQHYAKSPIKTAKPKRRTYHYECSVCGHRHSRSRRLRRPSSCARCDKKYNPLYPLKLVAIEP